MHKLVDWSVASSSWRSPDAWPPSRRSEAAIASQQTPQPHHPAPTVQKQIKKLVQ